MSQNVPKLDNAELMKKALVELRETKAKLQSLEKEKTEPIAIIGMGCRFPSGADNPEAFWNILTQGKDGITEVPQNRWNINDYYDSNQDTPGKMYTRNGGFVDHLQEFDASFFGISPREARVLDPQQRLLLEVSWEAIENAALNPQQLAKTQTGVFIGISSNDYSQLLCRREVAEINSYFGTGNAHSSAAGRLSYILGLTGPSLAVDTACSSSLVTVHLASLSLRNRESNLAIVGGVNRIITPEVSINFSKARMLSADGRCKTFDASADGFVRGEGCGIIVLKRLSDAIADEDNILAVIRGSAVNQDGHTSGLTVPNGPSQQAVIRKALENSGVNPAQVSYIEAHGTGTSLGDPIEVVALDAVFGKSHSKEKPLAIGSVKTNIGHLEAAAGIAGLIKVVLQLQHQKIAPHLHFQTPNPYINWSQLPLIVPTKVTPWQVEGHRIAGISSFSFSGTNAHVVLEQAPIASTRDSLKLKHQDLEKRPLHILTLSAKTPEALDQLVTSYQNYLDANPELELADICYTANTGRAQFQHRLAVLAASQQELRTKLSQVKLGESSPEFQKQLSNSASIPKIAFLFTGQGSQYVNMGRQLYETQPVFRQALDKCQQILSSYLDQPLLSLLYPTQASQNPNQQILDETGYTQPAVFAIEYALFQLWQSWGIKPEVVLGHSVGEYVAACVAGVFSLEDALKLIAKRGKFMQQLPPIGEMVAVMAGADLIHSLITGYSQQVAIAAYNGPYSTVISGATTAIRAICDCLSEKGIKFKKLEVSHAFHSPLMQPMLADFEAIANQVTYNRPQIALISNVTGQKADDRISTPQYWLNHILQPVRFADSVACLHQLGYETYLEIGSRPILLGMARQCFSEDFGVWLPSIRPGVEDWQQILQSLAQLYLQGAVVDWSGFDGDYGRTKVVLPTYAFQRKRYWVESSNSKPEKVESLSQTSSPPTQLNEAPIPDTDSAPSGDTFYPEYKVSPQVPMTSTSSVINITGQPRVVPVKIPQKIVQQQLAIMSQQLETLRANRVKTRQSPRVVVTDQNANYTSVIAYYKPRPNASLRLFCFHELGGSAYIFRQWADNLPPQIEVVPVELPGREGNSQEQRFTQFATVIQSLEQVIAAYLDKPFAFWGQSLGALTGFELAHLLRQRYGVKPIHFFVGGAWTPHKLIYNLKTMLSLSQEEILNKFLKTLEVPQSSQMNKFLMEIILSRLNADIKVLLSYKPVYSQGKPLDCPIYTFGGLQDTEVTQDILSQWNKYTLGAFKLKMIPGRHGSFLSNNQAAIWNTISKELSLYQEKARYS